MKTSLTLAVILIMAISCTRYERAASPVKPGTPKALQEPRLVEEIESFSKSRNNNLVDKLYREFLDKRADLRETEKLLSANNEEQTKVIDDYSNYKGKSKSYYNDANSEVQQISDSLLKVRIISVIEESLLRNKKKTQNMDALLDQIEKRSLTINDYHVALKILITLPIIEKFQDNNLPDDSLYRKIIKDQKRLMNKMDELINR